MKFRVKPASAASLLILMMTILRGQTQMYQTGDKRCPMCFPGRRVQRDCTEVKTTVCRPCSEGTFMNKLTELKDCFPCRDCDTAAGLRTKLSCSLISDTVCEPLEGFYCSVSAEDGGCAAARRHRSCRPGQHITHTGTSQRDTECSNCTTGTFSDGTFTTCQPHTQCETENLLLKPGTHSSDAECGERGSDRTVVIVIAVVGIIFLLIGSAVLFHLSKKIKRRRNIGGKGELEALCVEIKNSEDKPHKAFISAPTD